MPLSKASNAVLAKARALYGSRLTREDYASLAACRTMPELAGLLKTKPLYINALADLNPATARRANLELALRKSIFERYSSLCRYEMSAGQNFYRYFVLCCDIDEIITWLRYLDSGAPGDYLFVLPDFLQKHTQLDFYRLADARNLNDLFAVLRGTPYGKALAPLAARRDDTGILAQAVPLLAQLRHRTLMQLIPATKAACPGTQPGARDYIERTCDIDSVSYAVRLKRMHIAPAEIRKALLLDCTALSRSQWDAILSAQDDASLNAALADTIYGRGLAQIHYEYPRQGLELLCSRWCRKWLRFSTDPTLAMLCYLHLSRDEVSDLNHIIEGVHYGLSADEILPLVSEYCAE